MADPTAVVAHARVVGEPDDEDAGLVWCGQHVDDVDQCYARKIGVWDLAAVSCDVARLHGGQLMMMLGVLVLKIHFPALQKKLWYHHDLHSFCPRRP